MKHRPALLRIVEDALASGEISRGELENILAQQQGVAPKKAALNQVFYYLGGIIVLLGLFLLVSNYWAMFSSTMRIFITAGSTVVAYFAAIVLAEDECGVAVATPFFLIFALLVPIAVSVGFYELGAIPIGFNDTYLAGFSLVACAWAFYCYRRTVLLPFVVLYGSLYYLSLLKYSAYLDQSAYSHEYHLIAYLLLGILFTKTLYQKFLLSRPGFAKAMSRIGMSIVLIALLMLCSKGMLWSVFWKIAMLGVLVLNFSLALHRQDYYLRVFGFFIFILYVVQFTQEYFSSSLGWILSLIIAGLCIIAGAFLFFRKDTRNVRT